MSMKWQGQVLHISELDSNDYLNDFFNRIDYQKERNLAEESMRKLFENRRNNIIESSGIKAVSVTKRRDTGH